MRGGIRFVFGVVHLPAQGDVGERALPGRVGLRFAAHYNLPFQDVKSLLRASMRVGPRPALRQYQHVDDSVGTTGLSLGDNQAVSPTTDRLEPPWARQW